MRKNLSITVLAETTACVLATSAMAADGERLVSLNDPMAPFLETRKYAKKMGVSAEFGKMDFVASTQTPLS